VVHLLVLLFINSFSTSVSESEAISWTSSIVVVMITLITRIDIDCAYRRFFVLGSSLTVSMSSTVLIGRFVASKVLSISLILVVLSLFWWGMPVVENFWLKTLLKWQFFSVWNL